MPPGGANRAQLYQQYIEESQAKLNELDHMLGLAKANREDLAPLDEMQKVFHEFAGSGALYGAHNVSSIGGEGEYLCAGTTLAGQNITHDQLDQLETLIRRLRNEFQNMVGQWREAVPARSAPRGVPLLYVLSPDQSAVAALSAYLGRRGIQVEATATFAEGSKKIAASLPDLAAVSVELPDGSGYEFVRQFREVENDRSIPVLLLGTSRHFMDKVEAIHCGADGFVGEPLDPPTVFKKFKSLLARRKMAAAKILAVENDPAQARFLEDCLGSAGYNVRIVGDPAQFELELHQFRPNLILMDVVLPQVTGYDLVRYLRQEEGFQATPVIFLTTEARGQAAIRGAEAGGDDFLTKPVTPHDLLAMVKARLIRFRGLQELMDRDELTSLLAHIPFLQQARLCLSRFSRKQTPYAMVLVQLDNLDEQVARAGPRARDSLIQGLAKFLQRKIRQTDIMGRYGENLVAVVLEQLTEEDAVRLMLRLQKEFSELEHPLGQGRCVKGTFSAGIAMAAPMFKTLKDWIDAASDALKMCKRFGGHKTMVAGHELPASE
jgi:diguanylate cyclase (GGDEF)-like protein